MRESDILQDMLLELKFREKQKLLRAASTSGRGGGSQVVDVPKLEDAHWAGGSKASQCTLILTEGSFVTIDKPRQYTLSINPVHMLCRYILSIHFTLLTHSTPLPYQCMLPIYPSTHPINSSSYPLFLHLSPSSSLPPSSLFPPLVGDSAKALAVAGLEVVGRETYGVLPLRGKILNVRVASSAQLAKNVELIHLCKAMGLDFQKKYEEKEGEGGSWVHGLRYGRVMLMCDQGMISLLHLSSSYPVFGPL